MNKELTELFNGLNDLVEQNEAFSSSEQSIEVNGKPYVVRSFTYKLASWTEFDLPYAKDSRGTAFYKNEDGEWNLFCRAYQKFHNLGEGIPTHKFIKENEPMKSFEKMDGSLILFGEIDGKLIAKSKTSVVSGEAQKSQKLMDENILLTEHVHSVIKQGFTPVFELVGPDNVIVLKYDTDKLVLLGVVNNLTAEISTYEEGELGSFVEVPKVYNYSWDDLFQIQSNGSPEIEGFVVYTTNGIVKVKLGSYVALHSIRTNLNDLKSLAKLVISDSLDDLIGFYCEDQESLDYIEEQQQKIGSKYNHILTVVENVEKEDMGLDKREFAIKHQKENKTIFPILMNMYLKKEFNIQDFFINSKMYEKC